MLSPRPRHCDLPIYLYRDGHLSRRLPEGRRADLCEFCANFWQYDSHNGSEHDHEAALSLVVWHRLVMSQTVESKELGGGIVALIPNKNSLIINKMVEAAGIEPASFWKIYHLNQGLFDR